MGKSISKVLIWQVLSQFLQTGISVLTAPVFTRLLTVEEYGKFSNFNSWAVIIGMIAGLQTTGTIANAKVKYQEDEYKKYLSGILFLSLGSYSVSFILAAFFKADISGLISVDSELILPLVIFALFTHLMSMYLQILMMDLKAGKNALISLCNSASAVILSVLFIQYMTDNKYYGRVYGILIPVIVFGGMGAAKTIIQGKTIYNKNYWMYCLSLSVPLIFHSLAGSVLSLSDRIMINKIDGDASTAVYSVAYSIGGMINVLWTAFNNSWVPFYYQYKKAGDDEGINNKLKNYVIVFSMATVIFLLCYPEMFKLLMPVTYWTGLSLIPLVITGYYFNFLYSLYANFEFYHGKTKIISFSTVISAVINILLNVILIPEYGITGAALATLISYFVLFVFHWITAKYIAEDYCEINHSCLMRGLAFVLIFVTICYLTLDVWWIRWGIAVMMGFFLLKKIISQKAII